MASVEKIEILLGHALDNFRRSQNAACEVSKQEFLRTMKDYEALAAQMERELDKAA